MKPNDENGKLPNSERPFRVLILSGSALQARSQES
ncbi:hypothetical protein BH18ACI4_BH18ACI4_12950 [soil metagenome]